MVPFAFVCQTGSSHNNTVPNPESSHQQKAEKGEHGNTTDEKHYHKNKISALTNSSNINKTSGNIVKVPLNLVTDTPPSSPTSEKRTLEHSRRLVDKISDVNTVDTGVGDSKVKPTPSFGSQGHKKDMKDEANLESVSRQTSSQDYYSNVVSTSCSCLFIF